MKRKLSKKFIFLASQSPRRIAILKKLGIPFRVVPSRYLEKDKRLCPSALVMSHARGKVLKAVVSAKTGLVLGADTIVYCRNRVFGKPRSLRQAFRMLADLSGRWHQVYTGVALYDLASRRMLCYYAKTKVLFKKMNPEDIRYYLASIQPLDKAGAYAIQEGRRIVRRFVGSRTNVIGLPVELFKRMLKKINPSKKLRFRQRGNRISP